jgi:hypothetical protein
VGTAALHSISDPIEQTFEFSRAENRVPNAIVDHWSRVSLAGAGRQRARWRDCCGHAHNVCPEDQRNIGRLTVGICCREHEREHHR